MDITEYPDVPVFSQDLLQKRRGGAGDCPWGAPPLGERRICKCSYYMDLECDILVNLGVLWLRRRRGTVDGMVLDWKVYHYRGMIRR